MKRILLSVVTLGALAVGSLAASTAEAHGPHYCRPYGYGGGARYGSYYTPYNVYRAPYAPYGAGYSGGWQPYGGAIYQQPRFGMYLGF